MFNQTGKISSQIFGATSSLSYRNSPQNKTPTKKARGKANEMKMKSLIFLNRGRFLIKTEFDPLKSFNKATQKKISWTT